MNRYLIFSLLAIFLSGCAVHSPMSEMLMFQQKEGYNGKTYKSRYSHSIVSVTSNLHSPARINKYAEQQEPTRSDRRYNYNTAPTILTNLIFMSEHSDRFAFSVGVGNNIGIDATAKVYEDLFLSGAASLASSPQGQIILQKRLLDGTPTGLSVGISYQRNSLYVPIDGAGCGFCFPSEDFGTNSVGIRTVGLLAPPSQYGKSAFFLHFTGSINYNMSIEMVYPKIGISLGIY